MGKKTSSGTKYVSKGERQSVNQKTLNGMKEDRFPGYKQVAIQKAWQEGHNPWMTIENPNKEETNKKFIKVRVQDIKGSYKELQKKMFIIK